MPEFTLQDIRDAADQKYGPTVVKLTGGDVVLQSFLRLSKEKRDEMTNLDAGDGGDVEDKFDRMFHLAAKTEAQAKRLCGALDLAEKTALVQMWTKGTQLGEAEPSPN